GRVRSPEEGRRAAEVIVQESKRLGALVDTVLLFSRISRQRVTISRVATDVGALARDVVESFRPFAAAKDATVVLDARGVDALAVDRDVCRQILLNLLDNAVKFGPAGQTIRVGVEASSSLVTLSVGDEGPGIAREHASRIWDAFWRAPGLSEGGSGLGLSIVRELARRHGGDAIVDDRWTRGAGFVVTLSTGTPTAERDRHAVVPA
ncbi:MAG TPA: HAMP domain-containing sensor histidine kinase, partial [Vicinamibacterales bacterium]|nr:HAMP domain-containing sensor histidine kinase [Vicinamibacterales bacterium]